MTKSKNNLFLLLVFSLILPFKSFASLAESEEKGPQIIHHNVNGAGVFAKLTEKYLQNSSPNNTILIADVHGVVTNHSNPNDHAWNWEENKAIYQPRGDMVTYFKSLIAREYLVLFSSAWPKPKETSACLASLALLDLEEEIQEGIYVVKTIKKYPLVTEQELKDAAKDQFLLTILKNRPQEEIIETPYAFFQQGHSISVASDFWFNRSKAFAPGVFFRNNVSFPPIETLIFIEDSENNIEIFKQQLPSTNSYATLKQVVIFKFPEIKGDIRVEDEISPDLLTLRSKE